MASISETPEPLKHSSVAHHSMSSALSITSYAPSYHSVASDEIELTSNAKKSYTSQIHFHGSRSSRRWFPDDLGRIWMSTVGDIKSTPWSWLLRRFVSHVLAPMLICGQLVLLVFMSSPGFISESGSICKSDGSFQLAHASTYYSPWKRDNIFSINMGYGSSPFGIAKFIDIAWDVVSFVHFRPPGRFI